MASKYWIKLYHEILDDVKMGVMSDHLFRRTIEFFLLAGEHDQDGILPSIDAMAWRLRCSQDSLLNDLEGLKEVGIILSDGDDWMVKSFAERQGPSPVTVRVQEWRKRQRNDEDDDVTIRYPDSDIDSESESESNADLFDQCKRVYEKKKGLLITDGQSFSLMINNFKRAGVTADDYAAAIDAMDADGRYKASKPTSYEKWAISYADKRKQPVKVNGKRNEIDMEKLMKEVWDD